jgi:hypothetical protein
MATDQVDKPSEADSTPGNQPSAAKFGPDELKQIEDSAIGKDSSPNQSSTAGGKLSYNTGGAKHADSSGLATSTAGGAIEYDTSDEVPESEQSLYNSSATTPGKTRFLNIFSTRRRKALFGGGITGIIIALFFGFSILQGPFQFIHIAQLLQQFHLSAQQDGADDRFSKIARYIRDPSKPQNTRLGILGNKWANTIEAKMNESGIKSTYTKTFGYIDGYTIDPKVFNNGSMTTEEIKIYFKDAYPGLTVTETAGKLSVSTEGKDLFGSKSRGLIRTMLNESGYARISGSVQARIMGRRAGVDWHPIKNLDNAIFKTIDAKLAEWRKTRTTDIEAGAIAADEQLNRDAQKGTTADETARNNALADSVANSASATEAEAQSAGAAGNSGDSEAIAKFQDSIHAKLGLGGAAAAGVLCLAKGLASDAGNIKQAQVVLPLIRMGMNSVAAGNQVMSGNSVDLDQLGFYSKLLSGKDSSKNDTSWYDAKSIQAELGKPQTGYEASNTLKTIEKGTPFDFLNAGNIGFILGGVCSVPGQAIQIAISFLGGPVSLLTQLAVSQAVGPTVESQIAHWLAGQAVDPNAVGADFGNSINYGTRLAANDQAIAAGGRQLSGPEAGQLSYFENYQSQKDFSSHNIAYRLFNPYDSRSAISGLIDHGKQGFSQNLTSLAKMSLGIGHSFSILPSLFSAKAQAATASNYDYGFSKYGFSLDELNNPSVKNPYANAEAAVKILEDSNGQVTPAGQAYIDRAAKCFGVTLAQDTEGNWGAGGGDTVPKYKDINNSECTDTNPAWLTIRFFVFDTQVMESMSCYQGDDQSCANVGFDNTSAVSTTTGSTTTGSLPSGSAQDLAAQLKQYIDNGKIKCTPLTNNDINCSDITNTASGTSIRGGDGCQVDSLQPALLGMLLELVQMGHTYTLSALCSDHHDDGLAGHAGGRAADFNKIDGVFMGPDDVVWSQPKIVAARKLDQDIASFMPKSTGFGQVQCHPAFDFLAGFNNFQDACHHQHVQVES